jgi:hypothetical protein
MLQTEAYLTIISDDYKTFIVQATYFFDNSILGQIIYFCLIIQKSNRENNHTGKDHGKSFMEKNQFI